MLLFIFHLHNVDFAVADWLYRWEGSAWTLKHHLITEAILHDGGRVESQTMGAIAIAGLIISTAWPSLRTWRRPLAYLVLSVLLSTLSISTLKQLVSMDCPWDLARYGGDLPFIGLFESRPANLPDTACFPAGHASAGYAWLALYFFFGAMLPRWRWLGLAIGLAMGVAFGVGQQLRGAHFLSHDIWTLMICWTISLLLAHLLLRSPTRADTRSDSPAVPSPTASNSP
ncbi:phosphatase PAP2 family protein [Halomonas sp. GXIMD04776]|uniref:phosphatase PAP2 family protein n=1 Tax=Halomonas sp. GXIMD04776 TaxID=3415605 RepID=UPI003C8B7301